MNNIKISSSWFQEGKTVLSPFLGDINHETSLLRIPSKG